MRKEFRIAAQLLICLVIGGIFSGCDVLYRYLDKEGAEEKALIGEIIPHERNAFVEDAQALLYLYGYNTGKVDGVLGFLTRNALEKFQTDNGLKPSRFIDKATWQKLNIFVENQLVIEGQLNVHLIQAALKEAGFNPGKIDGKMGAKTKAAVEKFQEAHELKVDGKIGYQTLKKLATYLSPDSQIEQ